MQHNDSEQGVQIDWRAHHLHAPPAGPDKVLGREFGIATRQLVARHAAEIGYSIATAKVSVIFTVSLKKCGENIIIQAIPLRFRCAGPFIKGMLSECLWPQNWWRRGPFPKMSLTIYIMINI